MPEKRRTDAWSTCCPSSTRPNIYCPIQIPSNAPPAQVGPSLGCRNAGLTACRPSELPLSPFLSGVSIPRRSPRPQVHLVQQQVVSPKSLGGEGTHCVLLSSLHWRSGTSGRRAGLKTREPVGV